MTASRAQVAIVGGGPAGASTAFVLARAGIDVVVLDRARFPRDKACSEYMSPQASRILADMGVLAQVEEAGAAHLGGMRVRAPNGTTFQAAMPKSSAIAGSATMASPCVARSSTVCWLPRARGRRRHP
jgi:2-polyprenyl-6-methoxyphenol hydroxylase-like FAD-dependent oxidoreductase